MKDATPRKILDSLCIVGGILALGLGLLRIFTPFSICFIVLPLIVPVFYLLGLFAYAWFKRA